MRGAHVAVVVATVTILVACVSTTEGPPECQVDGDCVGHDSGTAPSPCRIPVCHSGRCDEQTAPDGATPSFEVHPQPCHREVCDGAGFTHSVIDVSRLPIVSDPCKKAVCNEQGTFALVADPTKTIVDTSKGDCKKTQCNADGSSTDIPDDADVPAMSGVCKGGACVSGKPVYGNSPSGTKCLAYGAVCDGNGNCTQCAPPDASCTDPGPAASATSITSAVDFGDTSQCDDGGELLCGTLPMQTARRYFKLTYTPALLCEFDPSFKVLASANVRFCAFFNSPSFNCPVGTATPYNDLNGCCIDGTTLELGAPDGSTWRKATLTVEALTSGCTSYSVGFHL